MYSELRDDADSAARRRNGCYLRSVGKCIESIKALWRYRILMYSIPYLRFFTVVERRSLREV